MNNRMNLANNWSVGVRVAGIQKEVKQGSSKVPGIQRCGDLSERPGLFGGTCLGEGSVLSCHLIFAFYMPGVGDWMSHSGSQRENYVLEGHTVGPWWG